MHGLSQELDSRRAPQTGSLKDSPAGSTRVIVFEAMLDRIARDASAHMTAGPASDADLARLEGAIGHRLPEAYRRFLARLGGGIYYERHEVFGPTRAMIHDIELLPPITGVCHGLPAGVIPIHRAKATLHFMDLRQDHEPVPVFSLMSAERYPDFATFLREVIVQKTSPASCGA
jgi:hypothetical protein